MKSRNQQLLIVATLLTGKSPTGVETHFNLIMSYASSRGIETILVNPHYGHWLVSRIPNGIGRLIRLFNPEYSTMWHRMVSSRRLKRRLRFVLDNNVGRVITLYAQDPLSAAAALAERKNFSFFFTCRQGSDHAKQPDHSLERLFCHLEPPVKK